MRNIWVTKRSIILGLIMVYTVMTGLTACAGNESDKKQIARETTSDIVVDAQQNVEQGNSNGNIANSGMLMKQGDWIYY